MVGVALLSPHASTRLRRLKASYRRLFDAWYVGGDERVFTKLRHVIALIDEASHA